MSSANKLRPQPTSFDALRAFYHSVHQAERSEVIEILGSMPEPEAKRELIRLYRECEWRENRLQIIRVLSRNPNQRGLEFLFRLAQEEKDIPVAETAIWSLGQSHHRLAALFLVQFFRNCGEILQPSVVGALGQIPDRTLLPDFLKLLPEAVREYKTRLARNLVLTLGELKAKEALPLFLSLVRENDDSEIRLSALIGIGKIARDPKLLDSIEEVFREDLFQYQLFTNIKTQVQFRSRWMLEDYLKRIFDGNEIHQTLPYELNSYEPKDVLAGLKLFSDNPKYFEKLCLVLSKIDLPEISEWYSELFDFKKIDPKQIPIILKSISCHHDPKMGDLLKWFQKERPECWREWLNAITSCLPNVEGELKSFFESKAYMGLPEDQRIAAVNEIHDHGLCIQSESSRLQSLGRILDRLLESDPSPRVQSRVLRSQGILKIKSKKTASLIRETLKDFPAPNSIHSLVPSCLHYLEFCPDQNLAPLLLRPLEKTADAIPKELHQNYLKSLTEVPQLPESVPGLETFLKTCLASNSDSECKIASLRFLQSHPQSSLLNEVTACLKESEEPIQLAALIALKKIGNENSAEHIAKFLESSQKSLAGRALDSLTETPGMRAKRIVIDYLRDHPTDPDICDKIIRCLKTPETPNDYFPTVVDQILQQFPNHVLKDGLLLLRDRISVKTTTTEKDGKVKGGEIQSLDRELAQKISGYEKLDEAIKSALRAAELPYLHRELYDEFIDKASSIVEYTKGLDLFLEKTLGKSALFPKLESSLHEFQNVIYTVGLNETLPSAQRVIEQLHLEKYFSQATFPLHKMSLVSQTILSGRILNEHFRTLDGLRAWAVMLLLFGRKIKDRKSIITLHGMNDDQTVNLCKRLMALQDIRNPFAHRQTANQYPELDKVRNEVFSLLSLISKTTQKPGR